MSNNLAANVSPEYILQAAEKIERENIELIPATKFLVVVKGKSYPPKEIVRVAAKIKGLNIEEYNLSGGESCNKHLRDMGFEIIPKGDALDPIARLIIEYKKRIKKSKLKDEVYKWELVNENKGKPNVNAVNFADEIKNIKYGNLIYHLAITIINNLAKKKTEKLRGLFKYLFDESIPLKERILYFDEEILIIYKETGGSLSHHQDERSIATYLTFFYPEKYTIYKDAFYQKFCKLLGLKPQKKGLKYVHYLELINDFIEEYIITDFELIEQVKSYIPEYYDGSNHLLLAQDILYEMLDKKINIDNSFINVIRAFIEQAQTDNLKTKSFPSSYQDLKVKVSFGTGGVAKIPWIAFLKDPNKVQKGIYPGFLYYKEVNKLVLTYGLSETNESPIKWPNTDQLKTINQWYLEDFNKKPDRYETSYIKAIYDVNDELDTDKIQKDLDEIIEEYINLSSTKNILNENDLKYKIKKMDVPLNTILYGPPGTGKTYRLQNHYFDQFMVKETSLTKNQYLENIITDLTWWQVISIAVLDLETPKVDQIFNHEFVQKKAELSNSKTIRPTLWGQLQRHTVTACENVGVEKRMEPLLFYKRKNSTWTVDVKLLEENFPEAFDLLSQSKEFIPNPDKEIKNYEFVTFHQSFGYEDFIEGIKPIMEDDTNELSYEITDGVFKRLCLKAKANPNNKFAIFIDEINRGNVSSIFGELITLIEKDKRLGEANEITVKLPYSKEEFGVPNNLYVYGTMNTADRSVEALDTALRRRFSFEEILPDLSVIENEKVENINLADVLETINNRIELLVDRDHTIGHSYFINVNTKKALVNAFKVKIIPLLQEYFYGDYGKIGLVLGKGFVEKQNNENKAFATFDYDGQQDFITPTFILKNVDESSIINAMELLLNRNAATETN